jgi:hypothetical protein
MSEVVPEDVSTSVCCPLAVLRSIMKFRRPLAMSAEGGEEPNFAAACAETESSLAK